MWDHMCWIHGCRVNSGICAVSSHPSCVQFQVTPHAVSMRCDLKLNTWWGDSKYTCFQTFVICNRTHFTKLYKLITGISWKVFALTLIPMIWSVINFANKSELLWYVQNCDLIWSNLIINFPTRAVCIYYEIWMMNYVWHISIYWLYLF